MFAKGGSIEAEGLSMTNAKSHSFAVAPTKYRSSFS
jgi:hypothetical protein